MGAFRGSLTATLHFDLTTLLSGLQAVTQLLYWVSSIIVANEVVWGRLLSIRRGIERYSIRGISKLSG